MSRSFVSVVVVDARGTSLACLGQAVRALGAGESSWLRIAARCGDDLFDEKRIAACAALIKRADAAILILHGGADSIPGFEVLLRAAQGKLLHVQANSGSPEIANLAERLGLDFVSEPYRRRFAYLARGGAVNLRNLLCLIGRELGCAAPPEPAAPENLPTEGIHHPGWNGGLSDRDGYLAWQRQRLGADAPVIGIWFHQTHWVNGDVEFVDALTAAVEAKGGIPLPVFHIRRQDADLCNMPLDRLAETFLCRDGKPVIDVLLSLMGFAVALQAPTMKAVLGELDLPVLHLIAANSPRPMWEETLQAVSPVDVSVNAAQPEFDGAVIGTVIACRDDSGTDPLTGARLMRRVPVMEQLPGVAAWAMNWARLRRTPAAERKIAILFHQYPPRADCLGSAIGLDTFESVRNLLHCLKAEGHVVDRDYDSGEAMAFELLDKLTNDRRYLPINEMAKRAIGRVAKARALAWHAARSAKVRAEMGKKWGPAPGVTFCDDGDLLVGGVINGNVFLGMQPPRAKMEDGDVPELQPDGKTIHDPFLPATHHYLAYYRWLREDFGAHAVFHIGTHGTLEWMPGKSLGLSQDCYPEAAIADLPNLYPYIVSNPGEGIQAKRRSHAVILDHMIPPQTHAGKTDAMEKLDDLLGKAYLAGQQDPAKLPLLLDDIWELVVEAHLDADLGISREQADADIHAFLQDLHGYLTRVEVSAIGDGLHIFGEPPKGRHFNETMVHLTRLPCGPAPSLWDAIASCRGFDAEDLRDHPGEFVAAIGKTKGQVVADMIEEARAAMDDLDGRGWDETGLAAVVTERFRGSPQVMSALRHVAQTVRPKLSGVTDELLYATRGAMGRFVPPGGSGCPTRGNLDILPTGRNFYSVDPYKVPSPEAWRVGMAQGDALIARYLADEGRVPETVGIILWGTATLRTGGNDVAEILYLMGMRPIWEEGSERVKGVEAIPLAELSHPRIDVTVRTAGLTRDALPNVLEMLDEAACMAAALKEPEHLNFLARNVAVDRAELLKAGLSPEEAQRRATFRVFCAKPGCYGAGVSNMLEAKQWETVEDLGNLYIHWGGYAYGKGTYGADGRDQFRQRLSRLDLTVKNEDSREYDMFTSDDFNSFHGGMNAAVKTAAGKYARSYTGDSSDPRKPIIHSTEEEARFLFRTRVLNPKWIEGMKRHGYKGAGDLSKTVDFCFQWDATSAILAEWQYQELAKTYAFDPAMQAFFKAHNPYAMQNIVERLLEAIARGMWENPGEDKEKLEALLLEAEGAIEDSLAQGMGKAAATAG